MTDMETLLFVAGEQLVAFDMVCGQMLQDVQERLVYRTHIFIRQEILNYNPAPGDLAYPEKLEMMEVSGAVICSTRSFFQSLCVWISKVTDFKRNFCSKNISLH